MQLSTVLELKNINYSAGEHLLMETNVRNIAPITDVHELLLPTEEYFSSSGSDESVE